MLTTCCYVLSTLYVGVVVVLQGETCDRCQPLFVGNPSEGKPCEPCSVVCNSHTDLCLSTTDHNILRDRHLTAASVQLETVYGPNVGDVICVECQNNTEGAKCDQCKDGYFRLEGMMTSVPCLE